MIENGNAARQILSDVRTRVAVASAKGGAGKSMVTVSLAAQMAIMGRKVGILDADFDAPSIATMLGLMPGILIPNGAAIEPASGPLGLRTIGSDLIADAPLPLFRYEPPGSADAALPTEDSIAPVNSADPYHLSATSLLRNGVAFGHLDLLLIDLPTGRSCLREIASVVELHGLVVVTHSSPSALRATRSLIESAQSLGVAVLGIVENMTAFYCSQCRTVRPLLPRGGVFDLSREIKLPLLARLPFDPQMAEACEQGRLFVQQFPDAPLTKQLADLTQKIKTALDQIPYHPLPNGGAASESRQV